MNLIKTEGFQPNSRLHELNQFFKSVDCPPSQGNLYSRFYYYYYFSHHSKTRPLLRFPLVYTFFLYTPNNLTTERTHTAHINAEGLAVINGNSAIIAFCYCVDKHMPINIFKRMLASRGRSEFHRQACQESFLLLIGCLHNRQMS